MDSYIGKTCPFCKTEIKEGDEVIVCPACGIPHHKGCWEENNGCSTFGCSEQRLAAPAAPALCPRCGVALAPGQAFCSACGASCAAPRPQPQPQPATCPRCGIALAPGQAFCPACGASCAAPQPRTCNNCGTPLNAEQLFCPKCGNKTDVMMDPNVSSAINQFNQTVVTKSKPKSKLWILIPAIIVAIALVVGVGSAAVKNAQKEVLSNMLQSYDWWRYDDTTKLYLEFSDDEIVYSGYFGSYLGHQEIATIDYSVVDGDTILVYGAEVDVREEDEYIVFTPSFTNTENNQLWMK